MNNYTVYSSTHINIELKNTLFGSRSINVLLELSVTNRSHVCMTKYKKYERSSCVSTTMFGPETTHRYQLVIYSSLYKGCYQNNENFQFSPSISRNIFLSMQSHESWMRCLTGSVLIMKC